MGEPESSPGNVDEGSPRQERALSRLRQQRAGRVPRVRHFPDLSLLAVSGPIRWSDREKEYAALHPPATDDRAALALSPEI